MACKLFLHYCHITKQNVQACVARAVPVCVGMAVAVLMLCASPAAFAEKVTISHGVSIFGDLKYPANFKHFDYVNPDAPRGGHVKMASIGTYDSLNPFIMKGVAADGVDMMFETLTVSAADEAGSAYGLLAESVELPQDRSWVAFTIRPQAKWQDGTKVTADDVVFSFDTIKTKGHPYYRAYYRDITKAEALSPSKVKFTLADPNNRELALIIGQLPILSKAYYQTHDFEKTTLEPPLGSGPYKLKSLDAGRSIVFERDPKYWGWNLPVNRGRYNFDTIQIDYYRDTTVAVEALKAGEYDFRRENISKTWSKAYNIPQVDDGRMVKELLPDGTPTGMQCFVFNTRRADFSNDKVREAISYAYDFEWANKQLFFSAYTRNTSFFGNSEYASSGLPDADELKLLEPFRGNIPERVFTTAYQPPMTDGSGNTRPNLLKAKALLEEAGWPLRDMKLINPATDKPVTIEFLLSSPDFERVVMPLIRNLRKLGIDSTIRTVDASQYVKRLEEFDFDVTVHWFTQGPSPGNEQIDYWQSSRADLKGSKNYIGVKDPAVDAMVQKIVTASDRKSLRTATRALDRILLWNHFVIPQWYSRSHRVIYWNKFGRPTITPPYALGFPDTWWIDAVKEKKLQQVKSGK